jgi:KDO2-lipid IV(A) lauroyltransferase
MTIRRRCRQIAELFLVYLGLAFIPLLPRKMAVCLARLLGRAAFIFAAQLRGIALANLDATFGSDLSQADKEKIAIESFRTFALVLTDLFWFALNGKRRIAANLTFDASYDYYFKTSPVIVVAGHIGNWEVLGQAMALRGAPTLSVAAPLDNPYVDRILTYLRKTSGQKVVFKEGAVKMLLRTLYDGARVGLILDQNTLPEDGGEFVALFGLPVPMSKAATTLSERTNAQIVLVYAVQDGDNRYMAYAHPVEPSSGRTMTQTIADAMEVVIRKHPGQWLWMYKRWKYIPSGHSGAGFPFYARRVDGGGAKDV